MYQLGHSLTGLELLFLIFSSHGTNATTQGNRKEEEQGHVMAGEAQESSALQLVS